MKKRKTRTSGEVTSTHQKWKPSTGPRCQRATIACPASATSPIPTENDAQKPSATRRSPRRRRIAKPPVTITASATKSHHDIGPLRKSSGFARPRPRMRKQRTSPTFDGLKTCSPRQQGAPFESQFHGAAPADEVLREQRDRRGADEDPRAAETPPVAVLCARHAKHEGDAVPGQHRARRPHEHALRPKYDRELEQRARPDREQNLRDRH